MTASPARAAATRSDSGTPIMSAMVRIGRSARAVLDEVDIAGADEIVDDFAGRAADLLVDQRSPGGGVNALLTNSR